MLCRLSRGHHGPRSTGSPGWERGQRGRRESTRKGATVLVVDYGIPGPYYDRWGSEPYWPEFKQAIFEDWRNALEAAALGHGFRVVHTYAAVNDATEKPRWNWSEVTSDGYHYNAEGHRRIAEILLAQDALGND